MSNQLDMRQPLARFDALILNFQDYRLSIRLRRIFLSRPAIKPQLGELNPTFGKETVSLPKAFAVRVDAVPTLRKQTIAVVAPGRRLNGNGL
jgi:hypothetical protein